MLWTVGHVAYWSQRGAIHRKGTRLSADLRSGRADGTFEKGLPVYLQLDLLIIDGSGPRDLSPPQAENLNELVCQRYHSSWLTAVSKHPEGLYALFLNPVPAEGPMTASSTALTMS